MTQKKCQHWSFMASKRLRLRCTPRIPLFFFGNYEHALGNKVDMEENSLVVKKNCLGRERRSEMNTKKRERIQKLKKMISQKDSDESVEQVLVKFCARTGASLDNCRKYYQHLVKSGEIQEE